MPPTTNHGLAPQLAPQDEDRRRVSEQLRVVLSALVVVSIGVMAIGHWTFNNQAFWTAVSGLAVSGISYWLNRRGRVDLAVSLLLFGMLAAITLAMMSEEGIHDAGMILFPTLIILGSLLLPPPNYRLLLAWVIASASAVWWMSWSGRIAPRFQDLTGIDDLVVVVGVLALQGIAANLLANGLQTSLRQAGRENAERRTAQEALHRLNSELEERVAECTAELAAANEELESFSYSVSHDLRAPLRAATGYANILSQEFAASWEPEARQLLARVVAANTRMDGLIDEMIQFAQTSGGALTKERVDMEATAKRIIEFLAAGWPDRNIEWVVASLPPAWADRCLIEQVYANLIGNALKYTGKKANARIETGFEQNGTAPTYFVRDNGIGFDVSQAERLFGVFERLHPAEEFEGNGIGLATVKRIVERHDGTVWADSEPGRGATFRFTLPALPDQAES